MMTFTVEYEQEDDGRWLAEVIELPGVLAYGQSSDEAIAKAQVLALRVLAERLEHGENGHEFVNISFAAARATGHQLKLHVFPLRFSELAGVSSVNLVLTEFSHALAGLT
jgi:predicted RNase H-like HicB family nuclease